MGRNRESAEIREEKQIKKEEKAEKKKLGKEKKNQRREARKHKKQEKRLKKESVTIEDNSEILSQIQQNNPLLRQKKIICLDLYGTLIFRPHFHEKIKHFLKNVGIEPFKKYYEIIQTNKKENVKSAYDSVDGFKMPKRAIRALQKHTDEEVKNTKIYPETLAVLKKLKNSGYKLALISNLSQDFEAPLRKLIPNGIIDYESLSYKSGIMKPDFEGILDNVKNDTDIFNGYEIKDMIMIGDSKKSDIEGAKSVGMDAVLINRKAEKFTYDPEKQLITIHTLTDLLDILGIDY